MNSSENLATNAQERQQQLHARLCSPDEAKSRYEWAMKSYRDLFSDESNRHRERIADSASLHPSEVYLHKPTCEEVEDFELFRHGTR